MGVPFDLKLDSTNDLIIAEGDLTLTTTRTEMAAQTLGITLKTFKGEWFLNTNFGTPYLQEIIGVARKKETVDRIFLSQIANNRFVDNINSYTSSFDRDERYYTMTVNVAVGEDNVTTVFSTQPSEEYIYPEVSDDDARITCSFFGTIPDANRLYKFINIDGLPHQTYSTWWNEWADFISLEQYLLITQLGEEIVTQLNMTLRANIDGNN